MPFTPSHAELGEHPKTKRLARLLGVSIPTAIGHLHLLWHFCLKYAQDGLLDGFEAAEIAEGAMWEGDPHQFLDHLQAAGFLEERRVHDWQDYGGKYLRAKRDNAARQKAFRDRHKEDPAESNRYVTVTSRARNALEERRGEKKKEVSSRGIGGGSGGRDKRAALATSVPDDFAITDELRAWAAEAAPTLDLAGETAKFLDHHRARGNRFKDWSAAWRKWMRQAAEWAAAPATNGSGRKGEAPNYASAAYIKSSKKPFT